jgi:ubiquinone/menaquinone biosynthesis C-methylase UbiE
MDKITPKQIYNRLSKVYDRSYKEPVHRIEDDFIYKFITEKGFTKGKILDLGSGTGTLLSHLGINSDRYTGLDISENMIELSSRKFPNHKFVKGTMSNMPFEDDSFDSVLSLFGSFSYSLNHPKTIQEINRVLKPNGKFFIMTYGLKYQTRESYILNKFKINSPARFFKRNELKAFFKDFDNVKIFGMTMLSEELSKRFPYSISKAYHFVETNILGSIIPDKFYFLIITGNKHA